MKELKKRIEDLNLAIRLTEISFRNCDTPHYKDLHLNAIEYYRSQIVIAEGKMVIYTDLKLETPQ